MAQSPDCDESVVLEMFWPFIEARKADPQLQRWRECPFATTAEQIAAAEKALWCPLPESYKHFLLAWNGLNVPQRGQIADDISFLCCLDFLTGESPVDNEYPEWADIVRGNSVRFRWESQPSRFLNFAGDGGGNAYAFTVPVGGESPVFYWDHDGCEETRLANTFAEWLNALPRSLVR